MKFLNKIPHVLLLLAAVCLPTANAGRLISGGDPPLVVEDRCGNTATLDCSSQNANATCRQFAMGGSARSAANIHQI